MTPRCKITRVGGNLPLVEQFWVLRRPSLLTTRYSSFFPFPFPLLFFFFLLFLLFSSFFFSPFLPFSFPFLLPSSLSYELFVTYLYYLHLPCKWTHGFPCVTHMDCHVSCEDMQVDTWLAMLSPDTRCLKIREIPTVSKSNEIRLSY